MFTYQNFDNFRGFYSQNGKSHKKSIWGRLNKSKTVTPDL